MGDEEAKNAVEADTQQTGNSGESTAAVPSQAPSDSAATAAADESTGDATPAISDKPEDVAVPDKDNTPASPSTPVREDDDDDNDDEANKKVPATDENTAATDEDADDPAKAATGGKLVPIVASSKKSRPPYKYDPNKISLRFIFANRDGLTVTVDCNPSDTVGEVKGALLSVWPEDLPDCDGGEYLRLICMGKGFLMPDTRTLEDCQIPLFKTHPTPINVSVRPNHLGKGSGGDTPSKSSGQANGAPTDNGANAGAQQTGQGCACIIL